MYFRNMLLNKEVYGHTCTYEFNDQVIPSCDDDDLNCIIY